MRPMADSTSLNKARPQRHDTPACIHLSIILIIVIIITANIANSIIANRHIEDHHHYHHDASRGSLVCRKFSLQLSQVNDVWRRLHCSHSLSEIVFTVHSVHY